MPLLVPGIVLSNDLIANCLDPRAEAFFML